MVYGGDYNTPDGTCIRDYIHVVDLAKAHVKAMDAQFDHTMKGYQVYNCGAGEGVSVLELIKTFEKVSGVKVNYEIGDRRPGDIEAVYADVSKVEKELSWKAQESLESSLKSAWNWQQQLKKDGLRS